MLRRSRARYPTELRCDFQKPLCRITDGPVRCVLYLSTHASPALGLRLLVQLPFTVNILAKGEGSYLIIVKNPIRGNPGVKLTRLHYERSYTTFPHKLIPVFEPRNLSDLSVRYLLMYRQQELCFGFNMFQSVYSHYRALTVDSTSCPTLRVTLSE